MEFRVDAHVHVGLPKYRSLEGYRRELAGASTTHVVLVQALRNYDNTDLFADARAADVGGVVVGVDFADARASESLAHAAAEKKFFGIRLPVEGDWGRPADESLWTTVGDTCRIVSVPGAFERIVSGELEVLARRWPETLFRLEHVGGTPFTEIPVDDTRFRSLLQLHRCPNVIVMWSGFFHNAPPYPYERALPHLAAVLEAFGAGRICWSGDVNRAGLAPGDYRRDFDFLESLPFLGSQERAEILGAPVRMGWCES